MLVSIHEVKPSSVTKDKVFDMWGRVVLEERTVLTVSLIKLLESRGIKQIDVMGDQTEELVKLLGFSINQELLNKSKGLLSDLDLYNLDSYTYYHSLGVARLSYNIGKHLKLTDTELVQLVIGALYHDIGKLKVEDTILHKPTKLTSWEYSHIKHHPILGAKLISMYKVETSPITDIVLYHHENMDGSGYPLGLTGSLIPKLARIVHVADVYNALTTDRPYRDASDFMETIAYMKRQSHLFDSDVLDVLYLAVLDDCVGDVVSFNDGVKGVVCVDSVFTLTRIRNKYNIVKSERFLL